MKASLMIAVMSGWAVLATAQPADFGVEGIGSVTIPVTLNKMTNLVFPEAIQTGVKVSREVLVQKVKGVENVIELKAVKRGFSPTNLSVYGRDGRLYSFTLLYVEDTSILNYRVVAPAIAADEPLILTALPASETRLRGDADELKRLKPFLKVCTRADGLRLRLTGVYLRDSLEWLVFSLWNGSSMPFRPERLRFYLLDSKQVKRKALQEQEVEPVYSTSLKEVQDKEIFAAGFQPVIVPAGKRLVVDVAGKDGRELELKLKGKWLLKARRV